MYIHRDIVLNQLLNNGMVHVCIIIVLFYQSIDL